MILRSQKCISSSGDDVGRDRLSEMPDEVIVHILSFMPTLYAVRTLLLRRFGNLWTLVPNLKFDLMGYFEDIFPDVDWQPENVWRFHLFVRNVLMLHKRSSIDKFYLSVMIDYHGKSTKEVDDIKIWLRFALDRQAKEIGFQDVCDHQPFNCIGLPNFTSEFLVTLELVHCELEPLLKVNLGSLKKLVLSNVTMTDESFQRFISGCPSLQELGIEDSWPIELSFSAPNIGKLSLVFTDPNNDDPTFLNCPNLKCLDIKASERLPGLINVSSVRDVNIYFSRCYFSRYRHYNNDYIPTMLEMFLGKLDGTEVFRLSPGSSEEFLHAIEKLSLLQNRWKRIILGLNVFCQSCLLGFSHLMRSSEGVEELTIYTEDEATWKVSKANRGAPSLKLPSPCVMPQLKIITLHGYQKSWNRRVRLIKFLRESAPALDKLVIVPYKHRSWNWMSICHC